MTGHLKALLCAAAAAACFYYSNVTDGDAVKLSAESNKLMDGVLFPKWEQRQSSDPPDRQPLFQADPGLANEQAKRKGRPIEPNEDLVIQPDPGLLAKAPENQTAVQSAAELNRLAADKRKVSELLWYGGFVLLSLLAVIEVSLMVKHFLRPSQQVNNDATQTDSRHRVEDRPRDHGGNREPDEGGGEDYLFS